MILIRQRLSVTFPSILIVSLTALFFWGCATPSGKKQKSTDFVKAVGPVSLPDLSDSRCAEVDEVKVRSQKWNEIMEFASRCVKAKQWTKVKTLGRIQIETFPASPWGAYFLSLAAEVEGDLVNALWLVDLGLKKSEESALLYYQKGRALWLLNRRTEAVEYFEKAAHKDDKLVSAHLILGQVYYQEHDYKKAESYFNHVLKVKPHAEAHRGLAECRVHSGDFKGALGHLEMALAFGGSDRQTQLRKGEILELLGQQQGPRSPSSEKKKE